MVTNDHPGQKKIQCWIPLELWDAIETLNYQNQTQAVIEALKVLTEKSQKGEDTSQDIPDIAAKVDGLKTLLEDKDNRIADLREQIALINTQLDRKDDQITQLNEATQKQAVHIQSLIQEQNTINMKLLPDIPDKNKNIPFWKFWDKR